jgi:hypothetical protein
VAVDDGAFAMGALVELADAVLTQEREVTLDFVEGFAVPGFVFLAELRAACHARAWYQIRFLFAIVSST